MLSMMIAYDADGTPIATLELLIHYDENGDPIGVIDFGAYEAAGEPLTDLWGIPGAVGSSTWPEWLSMSDLKQFEVELHPDWHRADSDRPAHRVKALVHKASGKRRDRAEIESRIQERIEQANGEPADIRDIVGGPDRPLALTEDGETKPRVPRQAKAMPYVGRQGDTRWTQR